MWALAKGAEHAPRRVLRKVAAPRPNAALDQAEPASPFQPSNTGRMFELRTDSPKPVAQTKTATRKWLSCITFLAEVDGARKMTRDPLTHFIFAAKLAAHTPNATPTKPGLESLELESLLALAFERPQSRHMKLRSNERERPQSRRFHRSFRRRKAATHRRQSGFRRHKDS